MPDHRIYADLGELINTPPQADGVLKTLIKNRKSKILEAPLRVLAVEES